MKWDRWIGSREPHRPVMLTKHLVNIYKPFRFVIDLHKMIAADMVQCYHTHPYDALRIPLWGGYVEELVDGTHKFIWPFRISIVTYDYCHRVHSMLLARASYSLWIRFEAPYPIDTRGEGWKTAPEVGNHKGDPT